MKTYWRMPSGLRPHYIKELQAARDNYLLEKWMLAWRHLERAHILGQPWAVEHTEIHWKMLKFGIAIKDWKEIAGQLPRLVFGGVKSFVGKIPVGNTGGSNVPPLRPMEIPEDIKAMMEPYLKN
ncbi:MAG TPA: DUF3703 domain-containing protein [Cyclobacteriaceae bacterium]|nr:DUF3703 domain-containing protein [Cyclobacteriaceae bacterium]HMV08083.1 DUF3703 domain-containing protein [Cyclobacteriaceae bacterium]HMV88299.1 DUF3703 domain-containing protein [Cyclobacteriaceae bacterium]HMX00724.1 DUF3703 domain-containing protein [Cyclobacteriaceae bacterium]HMX49401.1 DUF3703 domain-containing protein [Cyclobacteriaceae bacterium]